MQRSVLHLTLTKWINSSLNLCQCICKLVESAAVDPFLTRLSPSCQSAKMTFSRLATLPQTLNGESASKVRQGQKDPRRAASLTLCIKITMAKTAVETMVLHAESSEDACSNWSLAWGNKTLISLHRFIKYEGIENWYVRSKQHYAPLLV